VASIFLQQEEQYEPVELDTIELHQWILEPDQGLFQEQEGSSSFFPRSEQFEPIAVDTIELQQEIQGPDR